jgi:hypothetical protein
VAVALVAAVGIALLFPAWSERASYAARGSRWIGEQRSDDATDGADVAALIERARSLGGGRVYAGLRGGWGDHYRVGQVPVYAVLANADADAVGFTRSTWSLMSGSEFRFDERTPAQYGVFGIRYLLLPAGRQPPVPARPIERRGRHVLYEVPSVSYASVVDTSGEIEADRTDLGAAMAPFLESDALRRWVFPTVAFGGAPAAASTLIPGQSFAGPPGTLVGMVDRPEDGYFAARVDMDRAGVVLLSASFDPRWTVTVDGIRGPTQMVAPGLVGVAVSAGPHLVVFEYRPYPWYWLLLLLGLVTILSLWFGPRLAQGMSSAIRHRHENERNARSEEPTPPADEGIAVRG